MKKLTLVLTVLALALVTAASAQAAPLWPHNGQTYDCFKNGFIPTQIEFNDLAGNNYLRRGRMASYPAFTGADVRVTLVNKGSFFNTNSYGNTFEWTDNDLQEQCTLRVTRPYSNSFEELIFSNCTHGSVLYCFRPL